MKQEFYLVEEIEMSSIPRWNKDRERINLVIRKFNDWQRVERFDEWGANVVLAEIDLLERALSEVMLCGDSPGWQMDIINTMRGHVTACIEGEVDET